MYYKIYPVARAGSIMYHAGGDFRHKLAAIHMYEKHLASVIDELAHLWDARFDPSNRLPHVFDNMVTGSVDTFPIVILRPKVGQRNYYNGKYKQHVVKVSTYRYVSLSDNKPRYISLTVALCCSFMLVVRRCRQSATTRVTSSGTPVRTSE